MPNGTYGGVRGRKTKVGRKLLRFPPTRLYASACVLFLLHIIRAFTLCKIKEVGMTDVAVSYLSCLLYRTESFMHQYLQMLHIVQ